LFQPLENVSILFLLGSGYSFAGDSEHCISL